MAHRSACVLLSVIAVLARLAAAEVVLQVQDEVAPNKPFLIQVTIVDPPAVPRDVDLPRTDEVVIAKHARSTFSHSSQPTIINGERSRRTEYSMSLLGQVNATEGSVIIPPVTVILRDGSRLPSGDATVRITEGDQRLAGTSYAAVSFHPPEVVPGQPTEMHYDLYLKDPDGLRLGGESIQPPAEASSEKLESQNSRVIGAAGDRWHRFTFRWRCTFIEPGTYSAGGQQSLVRIGLFNRKVDTVPVISGSVRVTAFPHEGRPADFSGLVGPLSVHAELDRSTVSLGEGTELRITVRGQNLDLLSRPELPDGNGYRSHPLEVDEVDGGRRFSWNIAPTREGTVHVQGVSLPYFDPATQNYQQAASGTVTLEVLPGRQTRLEIVGRHIRPEDDAAGAPAADAASLLGEPLRGGGGAPLPRLLLPTLLVVGLGLGLLAGSWPQLRRRLQGTHRGRQLARTLAAGDWEAADRLLHRLLPECQDGERDSCLRLIAAVESSRFGGGDLDDTVTADLRLLERHA